MAVLKTTSPTVLPGAPMLQPRNTLPSARTRTAGIFGGKNDSGIENYDENAGRKKTGERKFLSGSSRFH
jgi:hypothetical protein